jgi:hypothetical protein
VATGAMDETESPLNANSSRMAYTGFWIDEDDGSIIGPEKSGQFYIRDKYIYGPENNARFYLGDMVANVQWIYEVGVRTPTDFYVKEGRIGSVSASMRPPWLLGDE